MFQPVRTRKTFEEAVGQIVEAIRAGELRRGERLPSERALAAQMRISRPSLREAIKLLAAAGVVEVRPGGGTFVRSEEIPTGLIEEREELSVAARERLGGGDEARRRSSGHVPLPGGRTRAGRLTADVPVHREPDERARVSGGDGRPPIALCEVGPRDGLQNHSRSLEPGRRAELVERLVGAGLARIETASFVDPRRVPQMAGAEEVVAAIERKPGVVYAGLVLNERGYERFRATGLDEVRFALSATESFGRRNANVGVEEALGVAERILERARADGVRASATISVAFGCPFEGAVEPAAVARIAERLAGWDELVFADTIGVAVPRQVRELLALARDLPCQLGVHFHDTRGTGLANALVAVEAGASVLDASIGGLGGCPFAPNATGNICTEDLVYLLHGQGIDTGVDLDALIEVADWLEGVLGERLEGRVHRAGSFVPVAGFVRAG